MGNRITTGVKNIDEIITSFVPSELIVIGGRQDTGKTALALNIAGHVVTELDTPVALFSLESNAEKLLKKMLFSLCMIDANKALQGIIEREEWQKLCNGANILSGGNLFINDSACSVDDILQKARWFKTINRDIGLIIVDYLQLIRPNGSHDNREEELTEIVISLKSIAIELNVPIVILSEISQHSETEHREPDINDFLRTIRAIEPNTDIIMLLFHDIGADKITPEPATIMNLAIVKNINGKTGRTKLKYISACNRFIDCCET